MISLLLLAISVALYGIAHEKLSRRDGKYIIFDTPGTVVCIISLLFFLASTALALYNAYTHTPNGF